MPTTPRRNIYYPAPTERPSVTQIQQLAETTENAIVGDGWVIWPASLTAFGTGTQWAGRYERVGNTVRGKFRIITSANGLAAGTPLIGLPVAAHSSYGENNMEFAIGMATLRRPGSSTSRTSATLVTSSSSNMFIQVDRLATATVTASTPWNWANGDIIAGTIEYEAAP